jgi:hypothetical protein
MISHVRSAVVLASACAVVSGCGPKTQAARVAPDSAVDLSGKWNDLDARETSNALVKKCLSAPWLASFKAEQNRKPAVRIRGITNKSDEHIDQQLFIKSIEAGLVNSGEVRMLAQEGAEMASVHSEQAYGLSDHVAVESAAGVGQETGADLVVAVRLSSVTDQLEGKKVKLYKIDFELIHATSGEKVWVGSHEIKKVIEQDAVGW